MLIALVPEVSTAPKLPPSAMLPLCVVKSVMSFALIDLLADVALTIVMPLAPVTETLPVPALVTPLRETVASGSDNYVAARAGRTAIAAIDKRSGKLCDAAARR